MQRNTKKTLIHQSQAPNKYKRINIFRKYSHTHLSLVVTAVFPPHPAEGDAAHTSHPSPISSDAQYQPQVAEMPNQIQQRHNNILLLNYVKVILHIHIKVLAIPIPSHSKILNEDFEIPLGHRSQSVHEAHCRIAV